MAVSARKAANAHTSLDEAQQFLDITTKLEQGGEAARADVVKAQIQVEQRQRDVQDAELAAEKARIALAVLIFPDYRQDFTVVDDLETRRRCRISARIQTLAANNNPDIRAAQAAVTQQTYRGLFGARGDAAVAFVRLLLRHQRQPVRDSRSGSQQPVGQRGASAVDDPRCGHGARRAAR